MCWDVGTKPPQFAVFLAKSVSPFGDTVSFINGEAFGETRQSGELRERCTAGIEAPWYILTRNCGGRRRKQLHWERANTGCCRWAGWQRSRRGSL